MLGESEPSLRESATLPRPDLRSNAERLIGEHKVISRAKNDERDGDRTLTSDAHLYLLFLFSLPYGLLSTNEENGRATPPPFPPFPSPPALQTSRRPRVAIGLSPRRREILPAVEQWTLGVFLSGH